MRKLLFLAMILLILAPVYAWGANRDVPTVYATIQAAIDAAASGDTVRVEGGTYNEDLEIVDKSLTLEGSYVPASGFTARDFTNTPTILDPARDAYGLTILSSSGAWSVNLNGFIFTNSNLSTHSHDTGAINASAEGGSSLTLGIGNAAFGNTFQKFFTADSPGVIILYALESSTLDVTFTNNTIAHNFGLEDNILLLADGDTSTITSAFNANRIFDNHFQSSPSLFFFTQFGGSFTALLQNNLIINNTSIKETGGGINLIATSGENLFISTNDTIYGNGAMQGGGVYLAGYLTSHTLVSFTNSIINYNSASQRYLNVLISGNVDFGAAYCSLGPVSRVAHTGTYQVANNFSSDPQVIQYALGKPYIASTSPAIDKGILPLPGIISSATTATLTDLSQTFTTSALVGRVIEFTTPANTHRIVAANDTNTITFNTSLSSVPSGAYTLLGAPGTDIDGRTRPQGAAPDVGCSEAYSFTEGTLQISGQVTDLYTGGNIRGATVFLESLNGPSGAVNEVKNVGGTTSGKYTFSKLPAGDYRVTPFQIGNSFASRMVTIAANATLDFADHSFDLLGKVNYASGGAIRDTLVHLTVDAWELSRATPAGGYSLKAAPGKYLIFLTKTEAIVRFPSIILLSYRFYPRTAEVFSVGINGTATGGSTSTVVDTATPWGTIDVNNKIIIVTHANGIKEISTITSTGGATINVSPNFSGAVAAGDQYTIDPNGIIGTATNGSLNTVEDTGHPWGTIKVSSRKIIIFHVGGSIEYKTIASVTGNTLKLSTNLSTLVSAGDRYAILENAFVGAATGGTTLTIIDSTVPWGGLNLIGRLIGLSRTTTSGGVVKEVRRIASVSGGTITVDRDYGGAPVVGDSYEIDMLGYDFLGEQIRSGF